MRSPKCLYDVSIGGGGDGAGVTGGQIVSEHGAVRLFHLNVPVSLDLTRSGRCLAPGVTRVYA